MRLEMGKAAVQATFDKCSIKEEAPKIDIFPARNFDRYDPKSLSRILRAPINATPNEKLVRTKLLPCFNISPRTACAAKYKNPPPTCAMINPSQKIETFAKKKKLIAPPSKVVASTAATHTSARPLCIPAPIKRLPRASPSGTL